MKKITLALIVATVLLGWAPNLGLVLASLFLLGVCATPMQSATNALLQQRTPNVLLGRVEGAVDTLLTAAMMGSKPMPANIEAVMATGAPNPAMPSIKAPKQNATSNTCIRRSPVRRSSDRRITSKSPLSTVTL